MYLVPKLQYGSFRKGPGPVFLKEDTKQIHKILKVEMQIQILVKTQLKTYTYTSYSSFNNNKKRINMG